MGCFEMSNGHCVYGFGELSFDEYYIDGVAGSIIYGRHTSSLLSRLGSSKHFDELHHRYLK